MSERRLVRAECPKKRHRVAELVVTADGRRIFRRPRLAVGDVKEGRVVRNMTMGGDDTDLDDESDAYRWDPKRAACGCGLSFRLMPADLVRAMEIGRRRVVLRPRRL